MTSQAIDAQGTILARGDGGSPEVFTTIPDVKTLGGPTGTATVLNVTYLQSLAQEKRMGLKDEGQIAVTANYVPTDPQQIGLRDDRTNQTLRNFKITFSDGSIADFSAYVLSFNISTGVDEIVELNSTLEISGEVVWS